MITLCSTSECTTRTCGERSPEFEARGLAMVTVGRITGLRSGPSSGGGLWRDASPFVRGRLDCEGSFGGVGAERCAEALACTRGKEYREADLSGDCAREPRLCGIGSFNAAMASLRFTLACERRPGAKCAGSIGARYPSTAVCAFTTDCVDWLLTDGLSSLNGAFAGGSMGEELGAKKLSESEVTSPGGLRLGFARHWPVCSTGATMRRVLKRIPELASPIRRCELR